MELKIDSERVKDAAKLCPDAKTVLAKLFPEAFVPELVEFTFPGDGKDLGIRVNGNIYIIQRRNNGKYTGQIFLNNCFNWTVETDELGTTCLVARRKV